MTLDLNKDYDIISELYISQQLKNYSNLKNFELFYRDSTGFIGFLKPDASKGVKKFSLIYCLGKTYSIENFFETYSDGLNTAPEKILEIHKENIEADLKYQKEEFKKDSLKRFTLSGSHTLDMVQDKKFIEKLEEAVKKCKSDNEQEKTIPYVKNLKRNLFVTNKANESMFKNLKKYLKNQDLDIKQQEDIEDQLGKKFKIIRFSEAQYKTNRPFSQQFKDFISQKKSKEVTEAVKRYYEYILEKEFVPEDYNSIFDQRVLLLSKPFIYHNTVQQMVSEFNEFTNENYSTLTEAKEKNPELLEQFFLKSDNLLILAKYNAFVHTPNKLSKISDDYLLTWQNLCERIINTMDVMGITVHATPRGYVYGSLTEVVLDTHCKNVFRYKKANKNDIGDLLDGQTFEYKKFSPIKSQFSNIRMIDSLLENEEDNQ